MSLFWTPIGPVSPLEWKCTERKTFIIPTNNSHIGTEQNISQTVLKNMVDIKFQIPVLVPPHTAIAVRQNFVASQSCFTWFPFTGTTSAAFYVGNVNIKGCTRGFVEQVYIWGHCFTYSIHNNSVNVFQPEAWTSCIFVQWSIWILSAAPPVKLIWQRHGALLAGK